MFREFPARAGINRISVVGIDDYNRLPRASGDKPDRCYTYDQALASSPRQRG